MLQSGQILRERYEIEQQLGKKPGRQTYRALDLTTQQPVIVKLLIFGGDIDWEHFKLFEREGQVLQNLSHPAIPKYLDTFEVDLPRCRGFALVQSYIDAPSLPAHLQQGRSFSPEDLKQLAEALLQILIFLHQRHPAIIHRDLKPSNILLSNERSAHSIGQVYLIDFGSVQSAAAVRDGTFTVVGTYGYTAPEQFGGRAVPASDLYSLGATLIYLATGRQPADLPQRNGRIQFETVVQLSPPFRQWLIKMVEPGLDRRFNSAQTALTALQSCRLNLPPIAHHQLANSRIVLSISPDMFQVVIPPKHKLYFDHAFRSETILAFAIKIFPLVVLVLLLLRLPLFLGWLILYSFRSNILKAFTQVWQECGLPELRRLRLQINQYEILLVQELFGIKVGFLGAAPKREIKQIEQIHYSRTVHTHSETGERFVNAIEPAVVILTQNKAFNLKGLTEQEADWLAQALSDWLGIEKIDKTNKSET